MTSRNKRALCILAPGVLLLGWRLYALIGGATPAAAQAGATQPAATVALPEAPSPRTQSTGTPDPRLAAQVLVEELPWSRDPFAPATVAAQELPATTRPATQGSLDPPAYRLSGISESGGNRIAILSGKLVRKGSKLEDGLEVTDITSRTVIVRRGLWEYEFHIGQAEAMVRRLEQPR